MSRTTRRPDYFELDRTHPLANGLMFAGLGRCAGGTRYWDDSGVARHGTRGGATPPPDVWVQYLGRWSVVGNNTAVRYIQTGLTDAMYAGTARYTHSAWALPASGAAGYGGIVLSGGYSFSEIRLWAAGDYGGSFTADRRRVSSTTYALSNDWRWHHVAAVYDGAYLTLYVDGKQRGTPSADSTSYTASGAKTVVLCRDTLDAQACPFPVADPMVWNRALSPGEIRALANPADPMLGGLILPPRRRFWPVTAAASPIWAYRPSRSRIIGGGVA